MRIFPFFAALVFLAACSGSNSDISKQLSGSDSLVINFNTPQTNTIEKTMSTTALTAIDKLARFADGKTGGEYKCGYDGNLLFYKQGKLTGDISFNFSGDGCHHFMQQADGKLTATDMSNEAADFLKNMYEGKDWY